MVTGIPADIGNLQHLQILRLHHNNLSSLPYTIGGLWRTLKELELNDNDLSYLPSTLGLCKKLETLDLGRCPAAVILATPRRETGQISTGLQLVCLPLGTDPQKDC